MRSINNLDTVSYPKVQLDNSLGVYLTSGFRLDGSILGWESVTELGVKYSDVWEFGDQKTNKYHQVCVFNSNFARLL